MSAANRENKLAQRRAQRRAYRATNREKQRAWQRAHYADNREKILAKVSAYYAANREKKLAYQAAWRKANLEKHRAAARAWRKANPEKWRAYRRAWRKAYPEKSDARDVRIYLSRNSAIPPRFWPQTLIDLLVLNRKIKRYTKQQISKEKPCQHQKTLPNCETQCSTPSSGLKPILAVQSK